MIFVSATVRYPRRDIRLSTFSQFFDISGGSRLFNALMSLSTIARSKVLRFVLAVMLIAPSCALAVVDVYSPNPNHGWNRLHAALFVREKDGVVLDDVTDPPFWPNTKHLIEGESHKNALAVLREFTVSTDTLPQMTSQKRAVMQRDLIALVHWLAKKPKGQNDFPEEQRELAKALTQAIRFVALTADEIRQLPDNYAQATAAPGAINAFDEKLPERAFLPAGLLADDGDWLALEPLVEGERLAAPRHFKAVTGRSVVEIRFRHAGGREAGEKYLKELSAVPVKKADGTLNEERPQFPAGSMWALVRRALLMDREGKLVASPLVESVEARVYLAISEGFTKVQTAFMWELSRRLTFGAGGFHLAEARDLYFFPLFTFFNNDDPIERPARMDLRPGQPVQCAGCHAAPGIFGVQSFARGIFHDPVIPAAGFRVVKRQHLDEVAGEIAAQKSGWKLLRQIWQEK
jgi:hypothetical protein